MKGKRRRASGVCVLALRRWALVCCGSPALNPAEAYPSPLPLFFLLLDEADDAMDAARVI
jgi:hypothetical protein